MECTSSFLPLLSEFCRVFAQPSDQIFLCLMTGWVPSHRRRFVTELIWSGGCTRRGHHSRYHNFFAKPVCKLDTLSWVLAHLLVAVLAPAGIVLLAVDDTLCRKRGLTVYTAPGCIRIGDAEKPSRSDSPSCSVSFFKRVCRIDRPCYFAVGTMTRTASEPRTWGLSHQEAPT